MKMDLKEDMVDIFKVYTELPEEWHHVLKSIAKSLVDIFVVIAHASEEVGVRTFKAKRLHMIHKVAAQKKFVSARTTQKRTNHTTRTNNT